jgi:hypothetical protein
MLIPHMIRRVWRILQFAWLLAALGAVPTPVEQWDVFEAVLHGPAGGNPFEDVQLSARFTSGDRQISVTGFYDGDGIYRIRFMPPSQGAWSYTTQSNRPELANQTGELLCTAPTALNHGPVRVNNTWHFAYADGTAYVPIGTTCYSWVHQPDALEDQTLVTLQVSPFNKVRMCLLPGKEAPPFYPYFVHAAGKFDHDRFDPQFFRHFEQRIAELGSIGVEADVILFHPYHKGLMEWFDELPNSADDFYLRYVVARLSAYRNVWWSLANEYGQVKGKTDADWDHFFQVVAAADPYDHLRSIHNAQKYYDPNKPWVTHASIQNGLAVSDFGRAVLLRDLCRKPIVLDEVAYEGKLNVRWGDLSAQEMTRRFWLGTIAGTYVGHGETFSSPQGNSWTSSGGVLMGQSPPRIQFLKEILKSAPDIDPIDESYHTGLGGKAGEYYLLYFGEAQPAEWLFSLPPDPPNKKALAEGQNYRVDVLDTWNMTITPVDGVFTLGKQQGYEFHDRQERKITLPAQPYLALRIERVR